MKMRLILRVAERISQGEPPRKAEQPPTPPAPQRQPSNEWESFLVNLATNYAA